MTNLSQKRCLFAHVDINSYFATMLQQKYPELRGRKVGVVKDVGRTCLIAVSKEAKLVGLKTGMGLAQAKLRVPDLVIRPAEFDFYLSATKKLKKLFESLAPEVEIYSLDEAFINLSNCSQFLYVDPIAFAKKVQASIQQVLGEYVTCNIGIAENRFLAKLAGEISPKGSVVQVTDLNRDWYLASAGFADVCGVGFALERKLKFLGVTNLYQLQFFQPKDLVSFFGKFWGNQLYLMAHGKEPHFLTLINKTLHMKSVGRSITGFDLCDSEDTIRTVIYNLSAEVIFKVRKMNLAGRLAWLSIEGNGQRLSAKVTVRDYLCQTQEFFQLIYRQLYAQFDRTFPIIRFSLGLGLLRPRELLNSPLDSCWRKKELLALAIDKINYKYGVYTVRSGLLKNEQIIYPEVTGFLGDQKYQLNYT